MRQRLGKDLTCPICSKVFYCKKVHLKSRKYCSSKCYGIKKREEVTGRNNPFYGKKHSIETKEINRQAHLGKPVWNKGLKGFMSGDKNTNWKGGRKMSNGYVSILMPEHPYATKSGYIAEHRYVVECSIGRFLTCKEQVHHINAIKDDNRPENLYLFPSRSEHQSYDNWQRKVKVQLTSNII